MGTWLHNVSLSDRDCLLILPGLDYKVRPRIGVSFSTRLGEGRTGINTRSGERTVGLLALEYTYTFPVAEQAKAAEFHAALLALDPKHKLALPIEFDRLTPAEFADDDVRVFDAQHTVNYDAASGAYVLNGSGGHPSTVNLVLCTLNARPSMRLANDWEYTVTVRAEEDSPWDARVEINTLALAAWTFDPDYAHAVEDSSVWQRTAERLGRGREKALAGDDAPTMRLQRAGFTFVNRAEIRQALTFFAAKQGQAGVFTVPAFLRPEWDGTPGGEPVFQARFGNDTLWLTLENQDEARTELTFRQVPILLEGEPDQEVPLPFFAVKLQWAGSAVVHAWTDGEKPVTIDGVVYTPRAIDVKVPTETLVAGENDWEIVAHQDIPNNPLKAFPLLEFTRSMSIEIREYRAADPDGSATVRMAGKVLDAPRRNKSYYARCAIVGGRLRASVPDGTVKTTCNHTVYDGLCGVNPATFTETGEISAVNGAVIDIDVGAARAAEWFAEGYAEIGAGDTLEVRHIVRSAPIAGGTRLTLLRPLVANGEGAAVAAVAGCDLQFSTCRTKFNNRLNFYGAPHKPPYIEAVQSGIKTKIGK
ncbi:phage BR0599 family protein [Actomonas aquatica]|uniref:Phage BR0599 family protein n=1 Tax=Actomonas aquatica TaxID=2866162 RepID=A0ABZ1CGL9_9BACT|nr:phage BR0599 family protein [Opitutus sp. WL0086]WRQ89415.1 phage BR0599 family protein [Opitutus sp. WL0086]